MSIEPKRKRAGKDTKSDDLDQLLYELYRLKERLEIMPSYFAYLDFLGILYGGGVTDVLEQADYAHHLEQRFERSLALFDEQCEVYLKSIRALNNAVEKMIRLAESLCDGEDTIR